MFAPIGGDSVVVISLVSNKERGFWKFNNWLHKFFDVANELFWRTRQLGYLLEAIMILELGLTIRRSE
ncbi:hypothetical protein CK203_008290 [Vitis vinifera]|uniref:Uncharacterized protein n=1 Tax=Vitis vinifera TaxID=29760 RepID=A0A438KNC6_VITVI|nr:hypothetical protein CK203_008290 [Vitis vinifera]